MSNRVDTVWDFKVKHKGSDGYIKLLPETVTPIDDKEVLYRFAIFDYKRQNYFNCRVEKLVKIPLFFN